MFPSFGTAFRGCKDTLHISQRDLQMPCAVETDSSANTVSYCCGHCFVFLQSSLLRRGRRMPCTLYRPKVYLSEVYLTRAHGPQGVPYEGARCILRGARIVETCLGKSLIQLFSLCSYHDCMKVFAVFAQRFAWFLRRIFARYFF